VSLFRLRLDGRRLVVAADRIVRVATLRPMTCTNGAKRKNSLRNNGIRARQRLPTLHE
jgi:hypothetical protein